jgi:hypothetical protein
LPLAAYDESNFQHRGLGAPIMPMQAVAHMPCGDQVD